MSKHAGTLVSESEIIRIMKTYVNDITCSCENQMLLTPGRICENCMGSVPESGEVADKQAGFYSTDYFEALENEQTEKGLAA